ncbi:MAG: hypothetical protein A2X12_11585 [Bacteroidetes bacterium GWE2_29_8]|nr:MAG: hypothetical protein A2X12_11585 [Bacteroidetes bacterium GWE2_29_8]OFY24388.1 MAG: hypothetical protein A2X02_08330 [Bacteroidetes bacterium GWF2_29_10]
MKNIFIISFFSFLLLGFTSCVKDNPLDILVPDVGLTEEEVANGLKEALTVGTDTSVSIVSSLDGFYKDDLIKILLPPEANTIIENISYVPGGEKLVSDVILLLNRSAEDAAKEAKPIFVNVVTSMTIEDAFSILQGEDTSATYYLKKNSYSQLKELFQPKINVSLNKPLLAGVSTNEAWNTLQTAYNTVANNGGVLLGISPITPISLDEYAANKALYGLFSKIAIEEKSIRKDPAARVTDLLKKVFGSVF